MTRSIALTLAVVAGHAAAQPYPAKPIQIIVPFSAGGDADVSARNLSAAAQPLLGQPIVVLNKVGAGGAIGTVAAKDAPADGYTLLLARIGSQVLLPALQPKTTPYRWNDFTVLGLLEVNPIVCVVAPDAPYKTVGDLAAALKAKPGKLNYSHSGTATVQNLTVQYLLSLVGLGNDAAIGIPYKGGNEVSLAVISREVDFACNNLSSMAGLLASGKLRGLVTTTSERVATLPDVPTARESGMPKLEAMVGWSALLGPKQMNSEAVRVWTDVLKRVAKDPKWIAGNAGFGGVPRLLPPGESEKFIGDAYSAYAEIVKQAGLEMK